MGQVLTTAATIGCGHPPGEVSTSSQAKLTVQGEPVLVADSVAGKSISGCTQTSSSTTPCSTAGSPLPSSLATKLTAGGSPVLLESLAGQTNGSPPGMLSATGAQQKLSAS